MSSSDVESCPSTPPSPFTPAISRTPPTHSTSATMPSTATVERECGTPASSPGRADVLVSSCLDGTNDTPVSIGEVACSSILTRSKSSDHDDLFSSDRCRSVEAENNDACGDDSSTAYVTIESEKSSEATDASISTLYSLAAPTAMRDQQQQRKRKSLQQMYLDFGQENFAKRTICKICGMLYVHGLSEDAENHKRVCARYLKGVSFQSTQARVVATYPGGSIVEIRPTDSYALRQKLAQVKEIVDNDLGFSESDGQVPKAGFLYVVDKRVVGMATAEIIKRAHRLDEDMVTRSSEATKAMVGVHQLWVHAKHRSRGIATKLIDAIRSKLVFGLVVPPEMMAFSSPTQAGARFAQRYMNISTNSGQNVRVLVYDCH